jgi:hypothetical protein
MTLRLDRLASAPVIAKPFSHVVLDDAVDGIEAINLDFPAKERFGPTIRMDGDLTAGDASYQELIAQSPAYAALHRQIYSPAFITAFLELFRTSIEAAYADGQLLLDPFTIEIVPKPIEQRVAGRAFVGGDESFLYPRFDIGYGGVGYGLHNGGCGIHVDNLPRLISILVFLNAPVMTGGSHRLYGLHRGKPVLDKVCTPSPGLMIASLQSNSAFHDVDPITAIEGERRAFYIAVSCSKPIWKKEVNRKLCALYQNRYDPAPSVLSRLLRLKLRINGNPDIGGAG